RARRQPAHLGGLARREDDRRAAVGDPRRAARGDDPRPPLDVAEHRRQLAKTLDGGVAAQMLIALDHRPLSLYVNDDRRDLARETTAVDRGPRLALALEREAVRLVARDAVLLREHFRRLAHDHVGERTLEAVA